MLSACTYKALGIFVGQASLTVIAIYKTILMPEIDKIHQCKQERGSPDDLYAVSIMKGDTIVGHVLVSCWKTLVLAGALIASSINDPHE